MIVPARQAGAAIGSPRRCVAPFLVGVALSISAPGLLRGLRYLCANARSQCWVMYARKNAPVPRLIHPALHWLPTDLPLLTVNRLLGAPHDESLESI